MNRTTRRLAAALVLASSSAAADVQKWPFAFDAGLAPDPGQVQQALDQGAANLPPLPVSELSTLTTNAGTMTLWLWPENAALWQRALGAGPGPMTWPTTATMCAKHATFAIPTLLAGGASPSCTGADAAIRQDLSSTNLAACALVEAPETYVYGYAPKDVPNAVTSLEGMIGVAGEALTHGALPPTGLLPADFVPSLRVVVDKLRNDTLVKALQTSQTAYAQAQSTLAANAACFVPAAAAQVAGDLTALSAELTAATAYLAKLDADGKAAHAQEDRCLAAAARARAALPFPSLTAAERHFLAFWLGGVYWRMRGGGLIPLGSTQQARLYYVDDAFTQIGTLIGGSDGAAVAVPFTVEVTVDGWSQWMVMNEGDGGTRYDKLIGMTERGQRQAQAGVNALGGYDAGDLMTGGLQMGPGYYFGWWSLPTFLFDTPLASPYSSFIDGPTAVGEFNIGAALGEGLARTLLAGKPTGQPPTVSLCDGRACGDDGCGGSCGACATGLACSPSGHCVPRDGGAPDDASATDGARPGSGAPSGDGSANGAAADDAPSFGGTHAGCGCTVGPAEDLAPLLAPLAGLAALGWRRRRKR